MAEVVTDRKATSTQLKPMPAVSEILESMVETLESMVEIDIKRGAVSIPLFGLTLGPKGVCVCVVKVNRRAVHELAVHYGLLTRSYDVEPKKYVSVIKQQVGHPSSQARPIR